MQSLDAARLALLDKNLVEESSEFVHLIETGEGAADLTLLLFDESILFHKMDSKHWECFANRHCADYLLLEYSAGRYRMHIFELKKSISETTWKNMKVQFKGGLQHSLALAGVLGISFDLSEVQLYSVYRNDKINNFANPTKLRGQMHKDNLENTNCKTDWNNEKIELDFLGMQQLCHHKVKLDIETGNGEYQIA